MKNSSLKYTMICCVVFLIPLLFAGVYRHDVKESKYLRLAKKKQFDCVGYMIDEKGKPHGSCVLIAKKFIVTAAHCFLIKKDSVNQGAWLVKFADSVFRIKNKLIHPFNAKWKSSFDIAVAELATEVNHVKPAALNTQLNERGIKGIGVGYGATGMASYGAKIVNEGKKLAGENMIDSIGGAVLPDKNAHVLLFMDFDEPNVTSSSSMGNNVPLPLEYLPAGGDSGCGLFGKINGQFKLLGILSGGTHFIKPGSYYGVQAKWSRVSAYSDWIKTVISP